VGNPYRKRRCGLRRGMEWEFVMEAKHTPTPWLIEGGCVYATNLEGTNRFSLIVHGGWQTAGVYRTDADELQANAAFIALAVNSHDALVEALKECADRLELHMKHTEDLAAHMKACKALALAGETP
jgi:hypothetical protein